jgi:hypothetical protein
MGHFTGFLGRWNYQQSWGTRPGVLISDFYAGYDAVPCAQQKCWVHLIRDMNDDLREAPFDAELETFVLAVKDLLIPIMECIQRYGLSKKQLQKCKPDV